MNNPSRLLGLGAMALVAALACSTSWAQALDSPSDPSARAAADPLANLLAVRTAEPAAEPATEPATDPSPDPAADPARRAAIKRVVDDIESYYTAPLRWDSEQWAFFGGALGAVALAHHYDGNVRAHFVQGSGIGGSTSDLQDALPAAALWFGTYLYSTEWHDQSGLTATWAMLEAGGLSTVTDYMIKYAVRRARPDQTSDPNQWFGSGTSFPSEHAAAAFAVGTVFAESGSGGYRWITRVLGYGIASFTAYERLKHNAHWLSDVVAGAALGGSTGLFVLDRTYGGVSSSSAFSVVPTDDGLMLAYHKSFP